MTHSQEPDHNELSLGAFLDDLCSRFILNCPDEEYESFQRLYFHIEEAHWFYTDFYRKHSLPSFTLKEFGKKIIGHCPLLSEYVPVNDELYTLFNEYKTSIPVMGAIILNPAMTKVLLVQGFKSRTWSFPRGKISKDERDEDCAVREVMEEVGLDISGRIDAERFIEHTFTKQRGKMFIIPDVDEDTVFETHTRGEIKQIAWHEIRGLSKQRNKCFHVLPYLHDLNQWIAKSKRSPRSAKKKNLSPLATVRQQERPRSHSLGAEALSARKSSEASPRPPKILARGTSLSPGSAVPLPAKPQAAGKKTDSPKQRPRNRASKQVKASPCSRESSPPTKATLPSPQPAAALPISASAPALSSLSCSDFRFDTSELMGAFV